MRAFLNAEAGKDDEEAGVNKKRGGLLSFFVRALYYVDRVCKQLASFKFQFVPSMI